MFLDLHLLLSNGFVSSKIYNKRNDFDFDMVNFPVFFFSFLFFFFFEWRRFSYPLLHPPLFDCLHFSELIWFARVSSNLADFIAVTKL